MTKIKYLLTIEGRPAVFDGEQICYAAFKYKGSGVKESQLCSSRAEVKKQIRATIKYRAKWGWDADATKYFALPIRLGE